MKHSERPCPKCGESTNVRFLLEGMTHYSYYCDKETCRVNFRIPRKIPTNRKKKS